MGEILSLKDAREAARLNRARIQQGVDVAAEKRAERLKAQEQTTVAALAQAWHDRHVALRHLFSPLPCEQQLHCNVSP